MAQTSNYPLHQPDAVPALSVRNTNNARRAGQAIDLANQKRVRLATKRILLCCSTGLMTRLGMPGDANVIDLQTVFDGDSTFGKGQLPLSGLHLTGREMRDKQLAPVLARLEQAYLAAGESLMRDPSSQAPIVAEAFQQAFQSIGAPQPMPSVLIRAIASGDLVLGPGPGLGAVRAGTISWLERVLDHRIPIEFAASLYYLHWLRWSAHTGSAPDAYDLAICRVGARFGGSTACRALELLRWLLLL